MYTPACASRLHCPFKTPAFDPIGITLSLRRSYTSHIVHEPLQVPNSTWNHFDFIQSSAAGDFQYHRQTYHAMVYYMDTVVGSMVTALRQKGMWENTLWVHQSDNGGPSFTGSDHTANNFPQRGKIALSIASPIAVSTPTTNTKGYWPAMCDGCRFQNEQLARRYPCECIRRGRFPQGSRPHDDRHKARWLHSRL